MTSNIIENSSKYTLTLNFPDGLARILANTTTEASSGGSLQTVDVTDTNGLTHEIDVSKMSEDSLLTVKVENGIEIRIMNPDANTWRFVEVDYSGGSGGQRSLAIVGALRKGIFKNNSSSFFITLYDQFSTFLVNVYPGQRTVFEDVTGSDFFTARYTGKPWTIMCRQTHFELPLAPESQTSQHTLAFVPGCDIRVDVSRDDDGAAVYTFS
jgi:hypothetical protein